MPRSQLRKTAHLVFLLCGVMLAAFGVEGFLQPSRFIDGGVTGVSMLLSDLFSVPLGLLIFAFNLPFLVLGYYQIGRTFFLKSFITVAGLALCITFLHFPAVTSDKVLASVFGGVFLGAGIGLSIRGGGVVDGTDILALVLSRRIGLGVGQVILGLNIFIFGAAAFLLGIEPALYSILTYASASRTVDFLIHGIEEFYSLIIISNRASEIRSVLVDDLGRGVTNISGRGGKSDEERDVLYCIVTRLEIPQIKGLIAEIDEHAFVVVSHVSDVIGGLVRRPVVQRLAD